VSLPRYVRWRPIWHLEAPEHSPERVDTLCGRVIPLTVRQYEPTADVSVPEIDWEVCRMCLNVFHRMGEQTMDPA
jgi:hypothetical protein